ncbi:hypothetical protein ACQKP7_20575 [Pseudomonas frederiksbergensis]|uniref:hypothetical protein n=1 Tax=Pseudomonas frederiksbergensis TaxID=104087 RepID=UPI003CFDA295
MHSQVITKEEMTCPILKSVSNHLKSSQRWSLEAARVGWMAWVAVVSPGLDHSLTQGGANALLSKQIADRL